MRTVIVRNGTRILLGKQGENNAVRVVWPEIAEKYTKLYGDGRFELVVVQKGQAYPAVVNVDGPDLIWNVLTADVATVGAGSLELIYYVGDTIAKSQTWETFVEVSKSAEGTAEPPEPAKNWVDKVIEAGQAAVNASVNSPKVGDNGNWFVWDRTIGAYADTGVNASGVSPHIGQNGNWFIGTEDSGVPATGPAGPAGADGKPGRDGVDGKDGLPGEKGDPFRYEDFTEEQLEALRGPEGPAGQPGHDGIDGKDGQDGYTPQKGVDYFDGEPGQPGEKGDKGDTGSTGPQGPAGYTPVKGTDYFTEEDKTEMVNAVLAALPSAEEVSY